MEGAVKAATQQLDFAFWQAWHTEAFARMEGRAFKAAIEDRFADKTDATSNNHVQAIAYFHRLKARGVPVDITRH